LECEPSGRMQKRPIETVTQKLKKITKTKTCGEEDGSQN